ncbi:hypothetical protein GH5_07285 [Leishmania sp. Ghana 2012 LV757]|uniref:Surface antigen-like protein n=1 Tax=Leishmania orientalis TaxID=2249476 RepID=A0A836I078_9TRYP|nr:hypothetical protein LSCM4_06793 [Leishmania orientalis]KAG5511079.1 hypothetical protein GH5_07285 [Leishmania sp. Ghana 2012 LV757]
MTTILYRFLLAFAAIAVATYVVAQGATCTVTQCAECVAGSSTHCAICNPGFQLSSKGRCVTNVNAAAGPHSTAATVAALLVATVAYVL